MTDKKLTTAKKINYRLNTLIKTFGKNSQIAITAKDYILSKANAQYIKYNKKGEVVGVRDVKDLPVELFGRSYVFDQYIPSAKDLLKRELKALKEEISEKASLKSDEKDFLKMKQSSALANEQIRKRLIKRANVVAEDLTDWDGLVDELYQVLDNTEDLYESSTFIDNAQDLLDTRAKTVEWVRAARELVRAYFDAVDAQERENE